MHLASWTATLKPSRRAPSYAAASSLAAVRSFTVLCGQRARMSVEGAIHLCKLFPALRSLTLYSVDSADLPALFALIHSVPTLEALHLFDIGDNFVRASTLYSLPSLPPLPYITEAPSISSERGAPSQSNLRVLSMVGRRKLQGPSFQEIAPFIRNAGQIGRAHV